MSVAVNQAYEARFGGAGSATQTTTSVRSRQTDYNPQHSMSSIDFQSAYLEKKENIKSIHDEEVRGQCNRETRELNLSEYPNLTDISDLSQMCPNLKTLILRGTDVTNLEEIGKLKFLEELDLSKTPSISGLWILPLAGCAIDGNGSRFHPNPGCLRLKVLKVSGIRQIHGFNDLMRELPGLRIESDLDSQRF